MSSVKDLVGRPAGLGGCRTNPGISIQWFFGARNMVRDKPRRAPRSQESETSWSILSRTQVSPQVTSAAAGRPAISGSIPAPALRLIAKPVALSVVSPQAPFFPAPHAVHSLPRRVLLAHPLYL